MKKKHLLLISSMIFALSFVAGCGPSYEEKEAKKEQERKEVVERQRQKEKQLLSHIMGKYEISHFPPEEFKNYLYTYELQKYFANQSNEHVAFKGYLEDLEQTDNNIFIEFSCVISNEFFINPAVIAFRLQITEKQAANFLNKERADSLDRLLGFFRDPDYIVVAKVKNISKIRKYEISGSPIGEDEVEIDIETPPKFIATGVFIDAVEIPMQKNGT